jgi:S-adenosylmethionine decarboxylase
MHGLHLTADLRDCLRDRPRDGPRNDPLDSPEACPPIRSVMTDVEELRETCLSAVRAAGLSPVGELFHRFAPAAGSSVDSVTGITGVVLLAESHLAVHTWPEIACATIDVYVCNLETDNSAAAHALMASLVDAFAPRSVERHALPRGQLRGTAAVERRPSTEAHR